MIHELTLLLGKLPRREPQHHFLLRLAIAAGTSFSFSELLVVVLSDRTCVIGLKLDPVEVELELLAELPGTLQWDMFARNAICIRFNNRSIIRDVTFNNDSAIAARIRLSMKDVVQLLGDETAEGISTEVLGWDWSVSREGPIRPSHRLEANGEVSYMLPAEL